MPDATIHALYAAAWLSFGLGHSLLAGSRAKALLRPALGPWYRLAYNGFAAIHVGLVWLAGWWLFRGAPAFGFEGWPRATLAALWVAGWIGLLWALRYYDLGRLLGTTQVRHHRLGIDAPEDEPLRLDGPHRWVRHPLYLGAFMILWGRITGPFEAATAVWGSLYLLIGCEFEERRLERLYGKAYAGYRRRVPRFVPWKRPLPPE